MFLATMGTGSCPIYLFQLSLCIGFAIDAFKIWGKTLINDHFAYGIWDCVTLLAGLLMKYVTDHMLKWLSDMTESS